MLESRQCPVCGDFYWPPTQFCQRDGTALLAERTLIGQLLDDRYRIESLLGAGGMGTVYRAVHVHLDSAFAVKVLHPDMITNEAAIERFRREAKAARRIQHRNAIAVTDFGVTADKLVYLVMEFVEGRLLRELIQEGPFEYHRAADILTQTAAAVEAAHNSGVVHRDLKPDNILIQKTGDKELVKVLDFGIAKLLEANQMSSPQRVLTKAGMIIGTPQYMSPEQCQGKELERASDLYSLGIIAYELLSGETPFVCDAQMQYISKHLYEAPPLLRSKAPRVPLSLERVIMRTLEKDPSHRHETAQEFARELRDAVVEADEQLRADEQEPTKDQHQRAVPAPTLVEVPVRVTPVPPGPATELISPLSEKPVSYTTRLTKAPQAPRSHKG